MRREHEPVFSEAERRATFCDDILRAVRRNRVLAQVLCPVLWDATAVGTSDDRSDLDRWHELARGRAEKLDAIAQHARRLLRELEILPQNRYGDFFDGDGWSKVVEARRALEQLTGWAIASSVKARSDARRPRGRRANRTRIRLSEWVALNLTLAGVRPTKAKTGIFARVLRVTLVGAGFPERTPESVEQDVRRALTNPDVADHIARTLNPPLPNSRSKRLRIQ